MLPTQPQDRTALLASAGKRAASGGALAARKDLQRRILADSGKTDALFQLPRIAFDDGNACLTAHEAQRAVKTLSLAQVRQPIHTGRRVAWRRHEQDLQPFIKTRGDTPWD